MRWNVAVPTVDKCTRSRCSADLRLARGERIEAVSDQAPIPSADTVAWLLWGDDPSVRYFALIDLLGAAPGDTEVVAARRDIMTGGTVPRILCAQGDDGHWGERDRYYVAKYRGTAWQLIILAELGADGAD